MKTFMTYWIVSTIVVAVSYAMAAFLAGLLRDYLNAPELAVQFVGVLVVAFVVAAVWNCLANVGVL